MYPTLLLQWFRDDGWHTIGWPASTPKSHVDLRDQGQKLSLTGGRYRLVYPPVTVGDEYEVVHEYPDLSDEEPMYRITVEIPMRAGQAAIEAVMDAVADGAWAAQPQERTDWDVFVHGTAPSHQAVTR
jgi:hypothetical protein